MPSDVKRTEQPDFREKLKVKEMIDVLWYHNPPEYRIIVKKIKRAWRKYAGRDEHGATN